MKNSIARVIPMLLLASLLSTLNLLPTLALPLGKWQDLGSIHDVSNIWALTCSSNGTIIGGTSNGYAESKMFSYHYEDGAINILGNFGVEVYSMTTGYGVTPGMLEATPWERIYGGSYKADPAWHPPAHGAHFFMYNMGVPGSPSQGWAVWNPGPNGNNNPYDMGPWHRLVNPPPPDASVPDEAIIFDLETGLDGMIYGCSGFALDVSPSPYNYAHLFRCRFDGFVGEMEDLFYAVQGNGLPTGLPGNALEISDLTIGHDGTVYFSVNILQNDPSYSHLFCWFPPPHPAPPGPWDLGYPFTSPARKIGALTTGTDGNIYIGSWADTTGTIELAYTNPSLIASQGWPPGPNPANFVSLGTTDLIKSVRTMTTGLNNVIYGGDFAGNFFVYEPQKGWNPGPAAGAGLGGSWNPHIIHEIVTGQDRIRRLITGLNGKVPYVFGGTGRRDPHLFSYSMITPDLDNNHVVNILDLSWAGINWGADPPPSTQQIRTAGILVAVVTISAVLTVQRLHEKPRKKQQT